MTTFSTRQFYVVLALNPQDAGTIYGSVYFDQGVAKRAVTTLNAAKRDGTLAIPPTDPRSFFLVEENGPSAVTAGLSDAEDVEELKVSGYAIRVYVLDDLGGTVRLGAIPARALTNWRRFAQAVEVT